MTRRGQTRSCSGSATPQVRASTPDPRGRIRRRSMRSSHPSPTRAKPVGLSPAQTATGAWMGRPNAFDGMMHQFCVELGWCGGERDGKRLHVSDFIPETGLVSADEFAGWLIVAE